MYFKKKRLLCIEIERDRERGMGKKRRYIEDITADGPSMDNHQTVALVIKRSPKCRQTAAAGLSLSHGIE